MSLPERPEEESDPAEGRVVLTEEDAREAARLLRLLTTAIGSLDLEAAIGEPASPVQLVSRARIIFHSRQARLKHFNRAMFGEPAWDILLALYINDVGGSRLTASRIAELIGEPFSTVVRWIEYLEKERFLERTPHPTDKRIQIVRLLSKGRKSLEDYLNSTPLPSARP